MAKAESVKTPLRYLPPWLDAEKKYSISIKMSVNTADDKDGIAYIGVPADKAFEIYKSAYTQGIPYKMPATGTVQLISPFQIKTIFIIPEIEKQ